MALHFSHSERRIHFGSVKYATPRGSGCHQGLSFPESYYTYINPRRLKSSISDSVYMIPFRGASANGLGGRGFFVRTRHRPNSHAGHSPNTRTITVSNKRVPSGAPMQAIGTNTARNSATAAEKKAQSLRLGLVPPARRYRISATVPQMTRTITTKSTWRMNAYLIPTLPPLHFRGCFLVVSSEMLSTDFAGIIISPNP